MDLFALLHNRGKLTGNAGRCSARANAIRFFRSARETVAPSPYLSAHYRCVGVFCHRLVCANAVYRTANDRALFPAAIEGSVEVAAKAKSGGAKLHPELVALAKIRGDKASGKKNSQANDGGLTECHTSASASQTAGQRGAAGFLYQRRPLQLFLARATRLANHPRLPGMDVDGEWSGRSANRCGRAHSKTGAKQGDRAHATSDQSGWRYLATGSSRKCGTRSRRAAGEIHRQRAGGAARCHSSRCSR